MEFKELLEPLAAACGIERLEPDESHMVHLGANGTALTIVGDPQSHTVVLFSELGDLPQEGREAFYEVALKANWLFQGGAGASLAISPESGRLALNRALLMDALDGESFVETVRSFLAVLVRWRELVRDWRGAVEDGTGKGAGAKSPSDAPILSTGDERVIRI